MSHNAFLPNFTRRFTVRRQGTSLLLCFLLSHSIATVAHPAWAQEEVPQAAPQREVRPIQNLKEGLEATDWNTGRRGPLIALDVEQVRTWRPEREPGDWYAPQEEIPPLMPVTTGRGLNIETVAQHFGRKLVRVGSVSVLAPTEMVVLNTRLPKPDALLGLRRNEKMTLFQALLDDGQWQKLCSDEGLGLSDLAGEQRDLFLSILPNPVKIIQYRAHPSGGYSVAYPGLPEGQYPEKPTDPRATLTDAQRAGIRLRINRATTMTLPSANRQGPYYGGGVWVDNQPPGGKPWFALASGEEYGRSESYGIKIREKVASRLKQGNLDFDAEALNPVVSLAEAKTVADLMQRIREVTRVEIYADARVGRFSIGGLGTEGSARSGDVLKALAWAITGAYRKVGPAFILTDDVVGIGTRRAYLSAWEAIGSAQKQKLVNKARRKIQEKAPMKYTRFASDDQMALKDDLMQRIESKWNTQMGRYQGEQLRLLDLPPAMQENARKSIENHTREGNGSQNPILTDRVQVNIQISVSLIIPGMGAVKADNFGWYDAMNTLLPPATESEYGPGRKAPSTDPAIIPTRMASGGILYVSPKTKEEAAAAAEIAKLRGLKQLWVLLPVDIAEGKEVLAAAIRAGKAQGIPVYAALRLMVAPPTRPLPKEPMAPENGSENGVNLNITSAPEERDRNILGETASMAMIRQMSMPEQWPGYFSSYLMPGDWLRPDAPLTLPALKQRVLSVANTPGLAGIVLRDLVPRGYETKNPNEAYYGSGGDYGYSEDHRLAMIRQENIDPVDLTGQNYSEANVQLPFFQDHFQRWIPQPDGSARPDTSVKDPNQAWAQLRFDAGKQTLADLYKSIRKDIPAKIPIIASELGMNFGGGWYAAWESSDKFPARQSNPIIYYDGNAPPTTAKRPVDVAREFSKTVYTSVMMVRLIGDIPEMRAQKVQYGTPTYLARSINGVLEEEAKQKTTWDGLVLDLTDYPMSEVKELILKAIAPPGTKPTAAKDVGK